MPNPVVFFEILGRDKAALETFYAGLFDWQLTPVQGEAPDTYALVSPGSGINGGLGKSMDGDAGHTTFYVEVADAEETLSLVESRGGRGESEKQSESKRLHGFGDTIQPWGISQ